MAESTETLNQVLKVPTMSDDYGRVLNVVGLVLSLAGIRCWPIAPAKAADRRGTGGHDGCRMRQPIARRLVTCASAPSPHMIRSPTKSC
jgi:hypothetical protein